MRSLSERDFVVPVDKDLVLIDTAASVWKFSNGPVRLHLRRLAHQFAALVKTGDPLVTRYSGLLVARCGPLLVSGIAVSHINAVADLTLWQSCYDLTADETARLLIDQAKGFLGQ